MARLVVIMVSATLSNLIFGIMNLYKKVFQPILIIVMVVTP
jgi:hypothetical protein